MSNSMSWPDWKDVMFNKLLIESIELARLVNYISGDPTFSVEIFSGTLEIYEPIYYDHMNWKTGKSEKALSHSLDTNVEKDVNKILWKYNYSYNFEEKHSKPVKECHIELRQFLKDNYSAEYLAYELLK